MTSRREASMRLSAMALFGASLAVGCGGGGSRDTSPPELSGLRVGPALLAREGTVTIEVHVADAGGVAGATGIASGPTDLEVELSETAPGTYTGTIDLTNPGDGEDVYEVRAEARDAAGNEAETASVQVIVDGPPLPPGA